MTDSAATTAAKTSRVRQLERLSDQRDHRPARGDRSFIIAVLAIIAIGSLVVGIARQARQLDHPTTADSWVGQLEIYDCVTQDRIAAPTEAVAPTGLRVRDGGLLSIEPIDDSEAGANATLGRLLTRVGASLDDTAIDLGNGTVLSESGTTCAGEAATLQVQRWSAGAENPDVITSNLARVALDRNAYTFVVALAPEGTRVTPITFAELPGAAGDE